MTKRTTVEVEPIVLKAIKFIAKKRRLKTKAVSNALLRWAIPYEGVVFEQLESQPTENKPARGKSNPAPDMLTQSQTQAANRRKIPNE